MHIAGNKEKYLWRHKLPDIFVELQGNLDFLDRVS